MNIADVKIRVNGVDIDLDEVDDDWGISDVVEKVVEKLQDDLDMNHLDALRTSVVDKNGNFV